MAAIVRFLLVALLLASCAPAPREAVYIVAGSASDAHLTLRNGTGGNEQKESEIPYRRAFPVERGAFLYISAQIKDDARGAAVTCRIIVDGEVVSEAAAEGFPNIATCSARAP